jgi:hypothetical protein
MAEGLRQEAAEERAELTSAIVSGEILKEREGIANSPSLRGLVERICDELFALIENEKIPALKNILACQQMIRDIKEEEKLAADVSTALDDLKKDE